jgi:leucyl/phenylalanyl-tRNA---protein transferase
MHAARLDPETLLSAYAQGAFPMTDPDGVTRWYTADPRGILPLDRFHVPRTLRQVVRQNRFEIRIDYDFAATMRACMTAHRPGGWISEQLIIAYTRLHDMGFAHSVESWRNGAMVGGLYGVSLGGAFFGESMFHRERDASKVALVHLVDRLRERGYELLDTQATTQHLARFGCIEIPAREYLRLLRHALQKDCTFVG